MRDKWFLLVTIPFGILIILDVWFTSIGLRLGLNEGNPIVVLLIEEIGLKYALMLVGVMALIFLFLATYKYQKLKDDKYDKLIYAVAIFALCVRIYAVSFWAGHLIGIAECMGAEQFVEAIRASEW